MTNTIAFVTNWLVKTANRFVKTINTIVKATKTIVKMDRCRFLCDFNGLTADQNICNRYENKRIRHDYKPVCLKYKCIRHDCKPVCLKYKCIRHDCKPVCLKYKYIRHDYKPACLKYKRIRRKYKPVCLDCKCVCLKSICVCLENKCICRTGNGIVSETSVMTGPSEPAWPLRGWFLSGDPAGKSAQNKLFTGLRKESVGFLGFTQPKAPLLITHWACFHGNMPGVPKSAA